MSRFFSVIVFAVVRYSREFLTTARVQALTQNWEIDFHIPFWRYLQMNALNLKQLKWLVDSQTLNQYDDIALTYFINLREDEANASCEDFTPVDVVLFQAKTEVSTMR